MHSREHSNAVRFGNDFIFKLALEQFFIIITFSEEVKSLTSSFVYRTLIDYWSASYTYIVLQTVYGEDDSSIRLSSQSSLSFTHDSVRTDLHY